MQKKKNTFQSFEFCTQDPFLSSTHLLMMMMMMMALKIKKTVTLKMKINGGKHWGGSASTTDSLDSMALAQLPISK